MIKERLFVNQPSLEGPAHHCHAPAAGRCSKVAMRIVEQAFGCRLKEVHRRFIHENAPA
jgi:hypothetical protein